MATYKTLDYLPDLTFAQLASARTLFFQKYVPVISYDTGWDNEARYSTSQSYALLNSIFKVTLQEGATYDFSASSYFDPFLLFVYDQFGNAIATDKDTTYGFDYIWNFVAPYSGTYYVQAGWDQGVADGHKFVSVAVYEDVDTIPRAMVPIQGSNMGESLIGTNRDDILVALGGDDTIYPQEGNDIIDGGTGIDHVTYFGLSTNFSWTNNTAGLYVTDKTGKYGNDTLSNVERLAFTDITVAFDVNGNAGKVYRLYQAAFNRSPDAKGLGFWIHAVDSGVTLRSVAEQFLGSNEFKEKYGTNLSNDTFVAKLYENILHRIPDTSGLQWWVDVLNTQADTRAGVLLGSSESQENQDNVAQIIGNGFTYTPYH